MISSFVVLLALASSAIAAPTLSELLAGANWVPTDNFDALHAPNITLPTDVSSEVSWTLGSNSNPDDYVSISLISGCDSNHLSPYTGKDGSNVNGIITNTPILNSVGKFEWLPSDVGSAQAYGLIIAVVNSATDPNDYKTDSFTFQYSNAFLFSGNGADPSACSSSTATTGSMTTTTGSMTTMTTMTTTTSSSSSTPTIGTCG